MNRLCLMNQKHTVEAVKSDSQTIDSYELVLCNESKNLQDNQCSLIHKQTALRNLFSLNPKPMFYSVIAERVYLDKCPN